MVVFRHLRRRTKARRDTGELHKLRQETAAKIEERIKKRNEEFKPGDYVYNGQEAAQYVRPEEFGGMIVRLRSGQQVSWAPDFLSKVGAK